MEVKIYSPAALPEKPKRQPPAGSQIVLPGELITSEPGFMRYARDPKNRFASLPVDKPHFKSIFCPMSSYFLSFYLLGG
jgi:hypothetical protein